MTYSALHNPTIFTIFGATGDLMARKIVPSLYYLYTQKQLPLQLHIIGFGRRDWDDDVLRKEIYTILVEKKFIKKETAHVKKFLALFHYVRGEFHEKKSFRGLGDHIGAVEKTWNVCANKLYYLAVPPLHIDTIIKRLKETQLSDPCGGNAGWARIIVEKPFGYDEKSARALEASLSSLREEQIYRIDHYFGKEMVQGILNFRFSNNLLEDSWDSGQIEKIEMKLYEEIGVEDRGAFYDSVGALRDVGQNHLLSILALLTMEHPINYTADAVRQVREEALMSIARPTTQDIRYHTYRAQYAGYQDIAGVKKQSNTETYFMIQTELTTPRWRGVPVYIESGKRLGHVQKEIIITFRHSEPCICPPSGPVKNRVIISMHPHQSITIEFWQRKPGFDMTLEKRTFDFMLYKQKSALPYVEEYAKLIYDAIQGNQTWFMTKREVMAEWQIVDPIIRAWEKNLVPLETYTPDSHDITTRAWTSVTTLRDKMSKDVGIIGLGRMGGGIASHLAKQGWHVVGYNRTSEVTTEYKHTFGIDPAFSLKELVEKLPTPRVVWLMLPNGKPVDDAIFGKKGLVSFLKRGDIIIDGGNSNFNETIARGKKLKKHGIHFLDAGVSGGPRGAREGACVMVGGDKKIFSYVEALIRDMSQGNGYQFFPGTGAGHFVKMVHNGIEYGMMQAIGEGYEVLKTSPYDLDLTRVTSVYNNGSVIESRLIAWLADAYDIYGEDLKKISGSVSHSGEGQWTVETAKKLGVPVKIIEEALNFRKRSQKKPSYTGKVVSALRGQFGEHPVLKQ